MAHAHAPRTRCVGAARHEAETLGTVGWGATTSEHARWTCEHRVTVDGKHEPGACVPRWRRLRRRSVTFHDCMVL